MAAVATTSALDRWAKDAGLSYPKLAQRLSCDASSAWRYGRPLDHPKFRVPPTDQMIAIYRVTCGAVTPNDFYDLPDLAAAGAAPDQTPAGGEAV